VEREDLVRTLGSTNRHDYMDVGGRAKQDARAEDRRFAQPEVARRVSYMDVANESLS
jgi:hypothetical protein